jgi:hypothetical protein
MTDQISNGLLVLVTKKEDAPETIPQLHINIWEKSRFLVFETSYLDIGLMLDVNDLAEKYEFVLCWQNTWYEQMLTKLGVKQSLKDLAKRLQLPGGISAIFNEVWPFTTSKSTGYVVNQAKDEVFTIVETDSKDLSIAKQHGLCTVQLKVESIRQKSKRIKLDAKKMYVRFRIEHVPRLFYRVSIKPKDRFFLSSWQRTEIIDFRMNVRRSAPPGLIEKYNAEFASFSKVHLFLMKSRDQDIVFEDKWFKACRSLEDENYWAGYAHKNDELGFGKWFSKQRVKNSLGYQWTRSATVDRSTGEETNVTEFGTLARFKGMRFGTRKFIVVVIILGLLGNACWDGVKYHFRETSAAKRVLEYIKPSAEK